MASEHKNAIPLAGWSELTEEHWELARFWVSAQRSFTLVAPDVASSPSLLGSLLVECVHTAAEGLEASGTISKAEALAEIWAGFDEERARLGRTEEEKD